MFDPQHIETVDYASDKLVKQFQITPDIYKRLIGSIKNRKDFSYKLTGILKEWKVTNNQDKIMSNLV